MVDKKTFSQIPEAIIQEGSKTTEAISRELRVLKAINDDSYHVKIGNLQRIANDRITNNDDFVHLNIDQAKVILDNLGEVAIVDESGIDLRGVISRGELTDVIQSDSSVAYIAQIDPINATRISNDEENEILRRIEAEGYNIY